MEDEQALDPSLPKGHKLSKVRPLVLLLYKATIVLFYCKATIVMTCENLPQAPNYFQYS